MDSRLAGLVSKVPSGVHAMLVLVLGHVVPAAASAGRALKEPVQNKSWGTVTLKAFRRMRSGKG